MLSSCAYGEVIVIDRIPEEAPESTALLAFHHDDRTEVFVYALPLTAPIRPPISTDDPAAQLELLLFSQPVERLFPGQGRLLPGSGTDPIPGADSVFTADVFDGDGAWELREGRSPALDAFRYRDPRGDPCRITTRAIQLQTEESLAELVEGDAGALYAVVEEAPGLFRVSGDRSTPIEVVPPVSAETATLDDGVLWVVTATGSLMAGPIIDDRVELDLQPTSRNAGLRWLIPNPYADGLLGMSRKSELTDVTGGRVLHTLPVDGATNQGSLVYADAVYFTTVKSPVLGRWDGQTFEDIRIPDDFGSAVAFVEGIGVLVGSFTGRIFRLSDNHELLPFVDTGMSSAYTIVPFPGGFVAGGDRGSLFRWGEGDRTCALLGLEAEDLALTAPFLGGAAFAPTSHRDRSLAGGQTPITIVQSDAAQ